MKKILLLSASMLAGAALCASGQGRITVDTGTKGHDIRPSMYGIFFEEINHSGDGALYAEMIQNRGFEEHRLPSGCTYADGLAVAPQGVTGWNDMSIHNWTTPWDIEAKKYTAWSVIGSGCTVTREVKEMASPLDANTPNAMQLVITASGAGSKAALVNEGYWGIAVQDGAKYDLRFYLRTSDYTGKVTAAVCDNAGNPVGKVQFDVNKNGAWNEYTGVITADRTINDGTFQLQFSGNGTIDVDYVSLFPQDTFRGRKNGLRRDVAEALEALSPAFIRWPGGCIVEGATLENRVKWKETLGDPMTRPGEWDCWGYRCTWGLGYHEALLFAEDINMDFMYVGNLGMACSGRNADYVTVSGLQPYIDEIEDAIQYAIGDPATNEWAAKRAAAGHPEKFPLKYVELGNENWTTRYTNLFNYAYAYFKEKYPELVFISTLAHYDGDVKNTVKTDMYDSHYYKAPDFFYKESTFDYDNVDRNALGAEIYVGEWACNDAVGSGNLDAALSECVYMNNMERNSDVVTMTSYAPLISNQNRPDWACNLIWVNNEQTVGRASYWAQQLYANNRPDHNVRSKISAGGRAPYAGRIALGTFETTAEFRNVKCTSPVDGRVLFEDDLSADNGKWSNAARGEWAYEDGVLKQKNLDQSTYFTMDELSFNDVVFEVEAKRTGGNEGFLINFGCNDYNIDHSWRFNIGGWGNTATNLESATGYWGPAVGVQVPMKLENNRWYRIKMVGQDGCIRCYIDDELIEEYWPNGKGGDVKSGRVNMAAGYDQAQGELVLKVVNAEADALTTTVNVNASNIKPNGQVITLSGEKLYWENSFQDPELMVPQTEEFAGFANTFTYTFKPYSLTIFRIKADEATAPIEFPGDTFSDVPVVLTDDPEKPKTELENWEARMDRLVKRGERADVEGAAGLTALRAGVDAGKNALAAPDRSVASLKAAWNALCEVLESFYQSNMIEQNEYTEKIQNPDYAENKPEGWRGSSITVAYNVAEYYNGNFGIFQEVEGLVPGTYMLTLQGFYRAGSNPWQEEERPDWAHPNAILSANGETAPLRGFYSAWVYENPWNMESAKKLFEGDPTNALNYVLCEVGEDGKLKIELTKEQLIEFDWTCWSHFRLFYVSDTYGGIDDIRVDGAEVNPSNSDVYDLSGRFVGKSLDARNLEPGVYITAGRKIVVR